MCAIVGINFNLNVSESERIAIIKSLISESSIRGRHATGMAWYSDKVYSVSYPIDGKSFIDEFDFDQVKSCNTIIIHCRYSTSDINYNQPIYSNNSATVHNGVITQEPLENWKEIMNIPYNTKNDTEILHNWIVASKSQHIEFPYPKASVACIHLDKDGSLLYFRNGKRPLYKTDSSYGLILSSTRDIILRCGIQGTPELLKPFEIYSTFQKLDLNLNYFENVDLQQGVYRNHV